MAGEEPSELEISYSPGVEAWLAAERVSLAFAIPPSKLFFIGLHENGRLSRSSARSTSAGPWPSAW